MPRTLTYDGRRMSVELWAREVGIAESRLRRRLMAGWPTERALFEPVNEKGRPGRQMLPSAAEALDVDPAGWRTVALQALPELLMVFTMTRMSGSLWATATGHT